MGLLGFSQHKIALRGGVPRPRTFQKPRNFPNLARQAVLGSSPHSWGLVQLGSCNGCRPGQSGPPAPPARQPEWGADGACTLHMAREKGEALSRPTNYLRCPGSRGTENMFWL